MMYLEIYKTHPAVEQPDFATRLSACFDLQFNRAGKTTYTGYDKFNSPITREFSNDRIIVMPGDRVLVPTGIIFNIPDEFSVRIHARSGLSLKKGLVLVNSEGVIDADYVEETMVMLTNISDSHIFIENKERVAQGELVRKEHYSIAHTVLRPMAKSERNGGFGSTGTHEIVKKGPGRPKKNLDIAS